MTFAIVPACGRSTRMGRAKLALPLGNRTVIERVVGVLREGGVERVLVVVGPHVSELIPLATAAGAEVLALPGETPDMRATVERGLGWIEERIHPTATDWWLLAPADHPGFSVATIRALLAAAAEATTRILVPSHDGRRGHPIRLQWRHAAGIRAHPSGEGINAYLRLHSRDISELPMSDPGILANLDTPEDYARLQDGHF